MRRRAWANWEVKLDAESTSTAGNLKMGPTDRIFLDRGHSFLREFSWGNQGVGGGVETPTRRRIFGKYNPRETQNSKSPIDERNFPIAVRSGGEFRVFLAVSQG